MAIINLKTDLRTLKYSNVLKAPYVYTSLPADYEKNPFPLGPKTGDVLRIVRAMSSIPGIKFAIHEAILGSDPATIFKIIGSTLAQVAVNGTGTHLIRGFNPEIYELDRYKDAPWGITRSGGRDEIRISRDSLLRREGSSTLEPTSIKPEGTRISVEQRDRLATPGLLLGKKTPVERMIEAGQRDVSRPTQIGEENENIPLGKKLVVSEDGWVTRYKDRIQTGPQVASDFISAKGTTGRERKEIPSEFFIDVKTKFKDKGSKDLADIREDLKIEDEGHISELLGADLIPFEFQVITPEKRKTLYFRAFLGDLSDDFTGTVGKERYVGRAEEFFIYQGFSRSISFSFKVIAFSEEHLKPMYNKLNALAGSTAPTYNKSGQFMRGTLGRVTIGDYIVRQYGMFEKIGISWKQDYPWEMNLEGLNILRVPQMLDISVSFLPIHTFGVEEGQRFFGGQN